MDASISLVVAAAVRRIFEREGTFLAFPLAPVCFSTEDLGQVASPDGSAASLRARAAFARQVNLVPRGSSWPPAEERYLWEVLGDVLGRAELAESIRTDEEEAELQRALDVLSDPTEDGSWADSAVGKAYKACKDAWVCAVAQYNARKVEVAVSEDPDVEKAWRAVEEPQLRQVIADVEVAWATEGYRALVESAKEVVATLGARSAHQRWSAWRLQFDPEVDTQTDVDNRRFVSTGFSPGNAMADGGWQTFSVRGEGVSVLAADAPDELAHRLGPPQGLTKVASLAFEYTTVSIERPWFPPSLFESRFWRLGAESPALSDGGAPVPAGTCPAYVVSLVLGRRVKVDATKSVSSATSAGTVPVHDAKPGHPPFPLVDGPAPHKVLLSGGPFAPHLPFGVHPGPASPKSAGGQVTHLPKPSEAAAKPSKPSLQTNFEVIQKLAFASPFFSAKPVSPKLPLPVMPRKPRVEVVVPRGRPVVAHAQFDRLRLPSAKNKTAATSTPSSPVPEAHDDSIVVLAFVCRPLPRCPDPDPDLHW